MTALRATCTVEVPYPTPLHERSIRKGKVSQCQVIKSHIHSEASQCSLRRHLDAQAASGACHIDDIRDRLCALSTIFPLMMDASIWCLGVSYEKTNGTSSCATRCLKVLSIVTSRASDVFFCFHPPPALSIIPGPPEQQGPCTKDEHS